MKNFSLFSFSLFVTLFVFSGALCSQEKIVIYKRNVDNLFVNQSLNNILELSAKKFGDYQVINSDDMEQARAFAELRKGNIDILVAAPNKEREQLAKIVYVPLDRGLLGFRLCMVHADAQVYSAIRTPGQFIQQRLTVGIGSNWPDRLVFEENGFNIVTSPVKSSLFSMLEKQRFDCLSRSVNEINIELEEMQNEALVADQQLVFIYPNSDFIFVNPNNEEIYKRVSVGVGLAIENNSYYEIFDEHYADILLDNGIYERKLIFLSNTNMSNRALSAINRFGVASFVTQLNTPSSNTSGN